MDPEVNHLFKIWNEYLCLKTPIENKPWTGLYNQVLLIYEPLIVQKASRVPVSGEGRMQESVSWYFLWVLFWTSHQKGFYVQNYLVLYLEKILKKSRCVIACRQLNGAEREKVSNSPFHG